MTVLKPNGQTQAVLSLVEGNSTIQVHPTTSVQGFITILQPNGSITQVIPHLCNSLKISSSHCVNALILH